MVKDIATESLDELWKHNKEKVFQQPAERVHQQSIGSMFEPPVKKPTNYKAEVEEYEQRTQLLHAKRKYGKIRSDYNKERMDIVKQIVIDFCKGVKIINKKVVGAGKSSVGFIKKLFRKKSEVIL